MEDHHLIADAEVLIRIKLMYTFMITHYLNQLNQLEEDLLADEEDDNNDGEVSKKAQAKKDRSKRNKEKKLKGVELELDRKRQEKKLLKDLER